MSVPVRVAECIRCLSVRLSSLEGDESERGGKVLRWSLHSDMHASKIGFEHLLC